MTRRCAWCRVKVGEVCPDCGCQADIGCPQKISKTTGTVYPPLFICMNHGCAKSFTGFEEGQGGITHGICETCRKTVHSPLHPRPPHQLLLVQTKEKATDK